MEVVGLNRKASWEDQGLRVLTAGARKSGVEQLP